MSRKKQKQVSNVSRNLGIRVSIKEFIELASAVTKINKPILLRGRHGIGKSNIVEQFCRDNTAPNGQPYELIMRRPSQMSEGDLCGIPKEHLRADGQEVTRYFAPEWYADACSKPAVLFLDELDRATTEVRQGFFELADSRSIFGRTLHPDTLVFAAINGGEHGRAYQVNTMDPAELDRWTVFDLDPTVSEWLEWCDIRDEEGNPNVISEISDFISATRSDGGGFLENVTNVFEPNRVEPSRRSWKRLSDCLRESPEIKKNSSMLTLLSAGFVGLEAAIAFQRYLETYISSISPSDIIEDGRHEETDGFSVVEHLELTRKIKNSSYFGNQMTDEQLLNLWDYLKKTPSEVFMEFQADFRKNSRVNRERMVYVTKNEYSKYVQRYLGADIVAEKQKSNISSAAAKRLAQKRKQ
jgi:MoxR-like ATPase